MSEQRRIAVAMSGGVDSSVAAAMLAETGDEVFGLMMRLWSDGPQRPNRCCSPDDMARARQVAAQLDIPFYALDVQDEFKRQVVDFFLDGYSRALTPNPCMECNRHIRWGFLMERALAMGATHLATGHYARVSQTESGFHLLRAKDRRKDQSYVLSVMGQRQLAHAIFPLGGYTKDQVRDLAHRFELPVADRAESQDLCFVGGGDYRDFLQRHLDAAPTAGPIIDRQGQTLGLHPGLANYTIGQRKGLGLSAGVPLYVLAKNPSTNELVVGRKSELGTRVFAVGDVHWVSEVPPAEPLTLSVRVRYKASEMTARVIPSVDGATVEMESPLPDVTPGQAAVFYRGEECLGGGLIRA